MYLRGREDLYKKKIGTSPSVLDSVYKGEGFEDKSLSVFKNEIFTQIVYKTHIVCFFSINKTRIHTRQ